MKRRRQVLQVSTFPFLAVLLCAMGSLILLLLVLDRRARTVAHVRAIQLAARQASETAAQAAARQAEWERRRQQLHAQLVDEQQKVVAQSRDLVAQIAATEAKISSTNQRMIELREQVAARGTQIAVTANTLAKEQEQIATAAKQSAASQSELRRLTGELQQLETALAELKEARRRQQQVYSLVPYRGKRGDQRRPIYLECQATALIFHPDRLQLSSILASPLQIREEIDRRLSRQRSTIPTAESSAEANAYLLLLVRPDGITTYYRVMAALQGLKVDFGYEFVDSDWVLDFPPEGSDGALQPWMEPEKPPANVPSIAGLPRKSQIAGRAVGVRPHRPGVAFGSATIGPAQGEIATPSTSPLVQGIDGSRQGGGGFPGPGQSTVPGSRGETRLGIGFGRELGGDQGLIGGRTDPRAPSAAGGGSARTDAVVDHPGISGEKQSQAEGEPANGDPIVPLPLPGTAHGGSRSSQAASETARSDIEAGTGAGAEQRSQGGTGTNSTRSSGGSTELLPPLNSSPSANSAASGSHPGRSQGDQTGSVGESTAADSAEAGPASAVGGALPRELQKRPRPAPFRLGAWQSNRDWLISIECTSEAIILYPAGQRFPLQALVGTQEERNPLLAAVQEMIDRRQATVRPGELPYRPMIRFRVRADGLRGYYLAYPILEPLHVPMSRENIDPDEGRSAGQGR